MVNTVRVMIFYDGNFFKQGNVYFNYKEEKGWFSLPQLHNLIERYVALKAKTSTDITKVVAAHYYDGRTTTKAAVGDQLEKERKFEMALIDAGIIPHYLPVKETPKGKGEDIQYSIAQKGVDVQLAIDVLDYAHADRYDIAVLITGDADFIPLVRRVTSLSKNAVIAYFSIDSWEDNRGIKHSGTYASKALLDAASWCLNFNDLIKDRDWKTEINSLFFKPSKN
ncbi:NYN domain-containing protein [Parachitinimonas caeni]|uniref:NYN domain-containing protein n=1 Tax=Parachitinimonas caeni TaxID=3031301 RepID=A0ABT7E2S0_9NEIS|nr:NYN domain-containing protein [Parachitinimonas caeni]MDK2125695.1 NYN domain-containing protein [Parachitinimonas caeni]